MTSATCNILLTSAAREMRRAAQTIDAAEISRNLEGMRLGVAIVVLVAAIATNACKRRAACDATDSVSLELCGPRKAWVGQWVDADFSRPRYIDIGPHGGYRSTDQTPRHQRLIEGDIVGFEGNDMKVRTSASGEVLLVHVSSPPSDDDGAWKMTVEGATYYRSAP
ncbi:MAG: hypothetical protein KF819_21865 [Labilithrix sp.]|nr:hypothetical protein [Labilithrix sp.]